MMSTIDKSQTLFHNSIVSLPNHKLIVNFSEVGKEDIPLVGGKGANLGELASNKFPVPPGFIVTVNSYQAFLDENNLEKKIKEILAQVDTASPETLQEASNKIERLILKSKVTDEVSKEIIKNYRKLGGIFKKKLVAVRSSATAEDLPEASFAGQQATFLNVQGEANLIQAVRECWASLFTARAIFYREEHKIKHGKVLIAVIVQEMIQSEVSGVAFTVDPVTGEKNVMLIEAIWGLGELLVQGSIVPDRYRVTRPDLKIISTDSAEQTIELVRHGKNNKEEKVPGARSGKQKLNVEQMVELAKILRKIHEHYYFPQDIEWAHSKGKFYIVQTRPVTTLKSEIQISKSETNSKFKIQNLKLILKGVSASPGIASGPVVKVKTAKELGKVKKGDILVTKMTSPDFVPAMKKVAGIVTDLGGQTSHAAIVSRELGIPCVVGARNATAFLKDGTIVTVDGAKGKVYKGAFQPSTQSQPPISNLQPLTSNLKTATKLYVNLAEPERASEVAKRNVDGVGLLRAEFMIAQIGTHPKKIIKDKKQKVFIEKLAKEISHFCDAFYPRPVVYRATDFKTNEYRNLTGGKPYEPEEPNPLLGFRGAFRYIKNPEVFELELEVIKRVREKGFKNLWLMIPYVHSPRELLDVKRAVAASGLLRSPTFKLWLMVELPVNVILLEDFIKVGIDGVSIGSNDLTMLILGTDRDNEEVAEVFDERSPAVLWALERVIKICKKRGITSSICGQAPSSYDDLVQKLVNWGITSISVNPDSIERVREVVYEAEHNG